MKKNKIIFICSAIFLFLIFSIFQYQKSKSFEVLSIKSPFEIVVDLNKNGVEDDNEVISILQGYEYISRNKVITENLDLKYNIQTHHAHSIVGYDSAKKTVQVMNPYNTGAISEVPISKLTDIISAITITSLN